MSDIETTICGHEGCTPGQDCQEEFTVTMPWDAFDADHKKDVVVRDADGKLTRRWFYASDAEVEAAWMYWGERSDWNAALPLYVFAQRKATAMVIHAHLDRERGVQVIDTWPPSRIDPNEVERQGT